MTSGNTHGVAELLLDKPSPPSSLPRRLPTIHDLENAAKTQPNPSDFDHLSKPIRVVLPNS